MCIPGGEDGLEVRADSLWPLIHLSPELQNNPEPWECTHTPLRLLAGCSVVSLDNSDYPTQSLSSGLYHYFTFIIPALSLFFQLAFIPISIFYLRGYSKCDATWVHSVSTNQHKVSQRQGSGDQAFSETKMISSSWAGRLGVRLRSEVEKPAKKAESLETWRLNETLPQFPVKWISSDLFQLSWSVNEMKNNLALKLSTVIQAYLYIFVIFGLLLEIETKDWCAIRLQ